MYVVRPPQTGYRIRKACHVWSTLAVLLLATSCSSWPFGLFAEEERDYFTQQEYIEFNSWCLDITDNPASKCTETADLVRYSINDAGYAKVDEACLVWEMQRELIGFGLYNSWDCIEE